MQGMWKGYREGIVEDPGKWLSCAEREPITEKETQDTIREIVRQVEVGDYGDDEITSEDKESV